jgi:hypothetical protein
MLFVLILLFLMFLLFLIMFAYVKNKNTCTNANYIKLVQTRIKTQHIILDKRKTFVFCSNTKLLLPKLKNNVVFLKHKKRDLITNKQQLYTTLTNYYPNTVHQIVPRTFIFPKDYTNYQQYKTRHPNEKFIYKTYSHRQEGLFISSNTLTETFIESEKFIIGQVFLVDTLKFKESKVSFRLYLIVSCMQGKFKSYYFNDGLVYYSLDNEIASFYDSDHFYKNNYPILISEFSKEINIDVRSQMVDKIKMLSSAIKNDICVSDNYYYELYGVDFHLTSDLNAYILEVNAGPGMSANNNTDATLRTDIFDSFIQLINTNEINSNLVEIVI